MKLRREEVRRTVLERLRELSAAAEAARQEIRTGQTAAGALRPVIEMLERLRAAEKPEALP